MNIIINRNDTIAAIATPTGRGSIGVLRISGSLAISVAYSILNKLPQPRQAEYLPFYDKDQVTLLDKGIALFFPNPHSFTGEDVLELHCHGGPIILDLMLQNILTIPGIRIAHPGEFSKRAFLNNKLDLSQAEAIADLIDASSAQAARSAVNSLQGAFSKCIYKLINEIINLRMNIEAIINFSDEKNNYLSHDKIQINLKNIISNLEQVQKKAYQGSLLREGIKVVIAGKPNAGKSSLLNMLTQRETAIVTAIPGTTRDVLHEHVNLDGIPLHLIDTAGLHNSNDEIECIGIKRAWHEIQNADQLLFIVDSTTTPISNFDMLWPKFIGSLPTTIPITIVRNKADLTGETIQYIKQNSYSIITLSAKLGIGIDLLLNHLKQNIGFIDRTEGIFLARRRHLTALKNAAIHLQRGKEQSLFTNTIELVAEELHLAQLSLSNITGEFNSHELLEKIFSNFCIGK